MNDGQKKIIAVDGASGYVGSHLIHFLCKKGVSVRAIVHPKASQEDCQFLTECGAEIFKTDLNPNSETLQKALAGSSAVVHLIGSIAPKKGQKLSELHGGMTTQLIKAAKEHSQAKVVMVTALGTSASAESEYHQSKWQAEEFLRQSGLPYLILQPSLILGKQVGRRDSKLMARYIRLIESRPRVPLLGGGKNLLQPIFVGDLSAIISKAALDPEIKDRTLELGGTEVLSMHDLIMKLMKTLEKEKPLQAIPPMLASLIANLLTLVSDVPLVTKDQVKLARFDNVCSDNATEKLLETSPTPLDQALASYKN